MLEQLNTDTFKRVRQGNLSRLFEERVTAIETNVIYAIATKDELMNPQALEKYLHNHIPLSNATKVIALEASQERVVLSAH